jgi:glutamate transport system permease protein
MDVLIDQRNAILDGFWETIQLLVLSGLIATVLGTVLGAMRVAPVRAVNTIGTSYVNLFRNTPLVVMFILVFFGLPELGIQFTFFEKAVIALSVYTAAFVCEAVRSGINTVPTGQAEAARSVGMTFNQTLGRVVLPQAFRAVVPPMASVYIALAKNTSVAAGFGVTEAAATQSEILNNHPGAAWWLFIGIGLGYVAIVAVISTGSHLLEQRWAVSR